MRVQTKSSLSTIVAGTLRDAIRQGVYAVDSKLPTEAQLCEDFQVSRTAIREAISMLVAEGLLERRHGVGTFVISRYPLTGEVNELSSFSLLMRQRGLRPGARLLTMEWVKPQPDVARQLQLKYASKVLLLRRLRLGDDQPVAIHTSYLPPEIGRLINRAEMEQGDSLYQTIERRGITLAESDVTIRATVASPEEAEILDISPGSPLLSVSALAFSLDQQPIEMSVALYRADLYSYHARARVRTTP